MRHRIDVLVFAAEENVYGVHANQIEELLSEGAHPVGRVADARPSIPYKGRQLRILRLSQYMRQRPACCPTFVGSESSASALPGRILVTTIRQQEEYVGLLIQELQQLVTLPVTQIFPLPAIMAAKKRTRLIWGIALLRDAPVILLDLEQL